MNHIIVKTSAPDRALSALGKRIAELRGGRSQREIALAAKIDVSTLSRIERGLLDPGFTKLLSIANALAVSPTDLLGNPDLGKVTSLDARRQSNEEKFGLPARYAGAFEATRSQPATLAALAEDLADTNDRVGRLRDRVQVLEDVPRQPVQPRDRVDLLAVLVPLLEGLAAGEIANAADPRVAALRGLAGPDRGAKG